MLADRLPYSSRLDAGDGGASLADIVADAPARDVEPIRRKDLRPIMILAGAICYGVTALSITFVSVDVSRSSVAKACIETGGEWLIGDDGGRECRREQQR